MRMEIKFQTKEESNKLQEKEFLALSPSERVARFFSLSRYMLKFPAKHPKNLTNNFVISFEKNG